MRRVDFLPAVLAAALMMTVAFSTEAQAQVFLKDSNKAGSSAARSDDGNARRGTSVILRQDDTGFRTRANNNREAARRGRSSSVMIQPDTARQERGTAGNYDYLRERVNNRRVNRSQGVETGTTYSMQEYNRRLMQQRYGQQSGSSNPYANRYNNSNTERAVTNPFTGRYSTQSQVDEQIRLREAYYKKYPHLERKKRTRAEEIFFNSNGYYRDDADKMASADSSARSQRDSNGNIVNVNRSNASTSDKYRKLYERYRNYQPDR